jgi:hypothetical protein
MRLKIIAGNLAIVLLLGLAAHVLVDRALRASLTRDFDATLRSDRELFERSFRLAGLEFVELVVQRSDMRQLRDVFAGLDLDTRRTRAYEAAEATATWLADPARGRRGGPDVAVIVDDTGRALARNGARNVMFGEQLLGQLPALAAALEHGKPGHDVWLQEQEGKLLQTAVAPIRSSSGQPLGALVVGYDLGNGVAKREAVLLGREIAFLSAGRVYSASLEGEATRQLRAFLFGPQSTSTREVLGGQVKLSAAWHAKIDAHEYVGVTSRLPMTPSHPVAVAVLANRSAQLAPAGVLKVIPILTAVAALLVLIYGVAMGNSIVRPIERIEEGILAVINGRRELRLETTSGELGGLAFRINQLLNVMTGTAEQTEDALGRLSVLPSEVDWKDPAFSELRAGRPPPASTTPLDEPIEDPAVGAELEREEEGNYVRRVYLEYAAAKAALGEDVSNLPPERFAQRLAGRATALLHKHGCRMVRFQVETRDEQVILRPVLIR